MIDSILKNRKYVREYDKTADIPISLIDSLLQRTWKITPSKNNFMPYTIHVLGPEHQDYKEAVYKICLSNDKRLKTESEILNLEIKYAKNLPNYANILSCSYLLIFTLRLETSPNLVQKNAIERGHRFEAVDESILNSLYSTASLEVGLFSDAFSALCLENNIDVSFTLCFHKDLNYWKDLSFVTRTPILLLTVGKGKIYRHDELVKRGVAQYDLRPDYARIVNFIDKK